MKAFLKFAYDFLIPHYHTEKVAYVGGTDDAIEILCCVDDLQADDYYDGLATAKSIAWLFWGFLATVPEFEPGAVHDQNS